MVKFSLLTVAQLERAVAIKKQIEALEQELESLEGTSPAFTGTRTPTLSPKLGRKKRTVSPESRARIAAAQKARWAKVNGTAAPEAAVAEEPKKKRKMSRAGKARIAAAAKARWAKIRAEKAAA